MKISTGSHIYIGRYGAEEGFRILRNIGYEACDFSLSGKIPNITQSQDISREDIRKALEPYREAAKKSDLEIFQTHSDFYPDRDSCTDEYLDLYLAQKKNEIIATKEAGCNIMVVHPLVPSNWHEDPTPELTLEYNIKALKRMAPYAEAEGVTLALENMPCHKPSIPCNSPEALLTILDEVASESVQICFDTGHANCAKYHMREDQKYECADYVRAFGKRIVCLHVHENNGFYDDHFLPMTCVTHGINWDETLKALKEVGYHGTFNSEACFSPRFPKELFLEAERFQYLFFQHLVNKYEL